MKKLLTLFIAAFAAVTFADVTVTIGPAMLGLTDEADATITVANGFFMLVADVDGDGLDGWSTAGAGGNIDGTINFTSGLITGDDVILYQGAYFADNAAQAINSPQTYIGVNGGEDYYAIWSDIGSTATDLGVGNVFGSYRVDDANWEVPASGSVGPFVNDANSGAGYYQSVPEPATALLLAIGAGCAWVGRRAKRHHTYLS